MKTEVLAANAPDTLRHAADVLRHNGLVAFPTDTVYGIGALAFKAEAVERLYVVKGRATDKAIAVLLARDEHLPQVTLALTPSAQKLAAKFWPGPLTLVVPKHPQLPASVSATLNVGVRVPDHALARQLLDLTGPLAVTSANRSGEPNSLSAEEVLAQLAGRVDVLIDGGLTPGGVPSTVVDCTEAKPRILRTGPISEAEIVEAAQ